MRRLTSASVLFACAFSACEAPPPGVTTVSEERIAVMQAAAQRIVILVETGADITGILARNQLGVHHIVHLDDNDFLSVFSLTGLTGQALVDAVVADPEVLDAYTHQFVENPEARRRTMAFNDGSGTAQLYAGQPSLDGIGLAAAHTVSTGAGVTVAILDTGIDAAHPAFVGATVDAGATFVLETSVAGASEDDDGEDENFNGLVDEAWGHGTHAAGLVRLVAPDAEIVPVRVLTADGLGTAFGVALGIHWAAVHADADVIALSLGLDREDPVLTYMIDWAVDQGIAVVASAGNDASGVAQHPAAHPDVVSVYATDGSDGLASFSNWGASVDIGAPGVDIVSAYPLGTTFGDYAFWSGTSMAVPQVAGAIALVHALGQTATPVDAAAAVVSSAVDIDAANPGYENDLGSGRLDAAAAVN